MTFGFNGKFGDSRLPSPIVGLWRSIGKAEANVLTCRTHQFCKIFLVPPTFTPRDNTTHT